jgi:hypothetical protein
VRAPSTPPFAAGAQGRAHDCVVMHVTCDAAAQGATVRLCCKQQLSVSRESEAAYGGGTCLQSIQACGWVAALHVCCRRHVQRVHMQCNSGGIPVSASSGTGHRLVASSLIPGFRAAAPRPSGRSSGPAPAQRRRCRGRPVPTASPALDMSDARSDRRIMRPSGLRLGPWPAARIHG